MELGISTSFQLGIPLKTNPDRLITYALSEKDNFSNLEKLEKLNLNVNGGYTQKGENDLTIFTKSSRHNQRVSLLFIRTKAQIFLGVYIQNILLITLIKIKS